MPENLIQHPFNTLSNKEHAPRIGSGGPAGTLDHVEREWPTARIGSVRGVRRARLMASIARARVQRKYEIENKIAY